MPSTSAKHASALTALSTAEGGGVAHHFVQSTKAAPPHLKSPENEQDNDFFSKTA